jgi:hypothetical protein
VYSFTHWLRDTPQLPSSPAYGLIYEDAIGQPGDTDIPYSSIYAGAGADPGQGLNPVPTTVQVFENESNREKDKNESFADDANNFTVLKLESLAKLKEILEAFRILSGLSCNVEKTSVMRIGNLDGDVDPEIVNLGFSFVDKMVLLGFILSNCARTIGSALISPSFGYLDLHVHTQTVGL